MSENNTPIADEPGEGTTPTDAELFAPEATSNTPGTPSASTRNKWIIPGVTIAGAALVSGLLGFSIGSHGGNDFRPPALAGQMAPGQGNPGMQSDRDGNADGAHQDKGQHGQRGDKGQRGQGQHGQPGMMPGGPQGGTDIPPTTPHCHDEAGADVAVGADGLCADGSLPGQRGNDKLPTPVPSASATTSIQ
jgi:hypothetical protein